MYCYQMKHMWIYVEKQIVLFFSLLLPNLKDFILRPAYYSIFKT